MLDGLTLARPRNAQPSAMLGTARLARWALQGWPLERLLAEIGAAPADPADRAGWLMDRSLAHALCFQAEAAAALQTEALAAGRVFRVRGEPGGVRLLALMAPGNLMVNAPLDFLTEASGVELTLAFTTPGGALPDTLPEHDVAIVAVSESAPAVLEGLSVQVANWPRAVLNDPTRNARLSRDWLAAALPTGQGLSIAATVQVTRSALRRQPVASLLPGGAFPVLLRPLHSHGGQGLTKIDGVEDLSLFLLTTPGDAFYLSQFIDYRGAEGWFCKYRIAFVDGVPHLCHMAASDHWMVHYVTAGMTESAAKRAAEAEAMASFDTGFAVRHAAALAALHERIGLDYFSIDCGVAPDGTLLVFEADVAAIIHSLDDPAVFPYKAAPMQRCYDAFAAMVKRRM